MHRLLLPEVMRLLLIGWQEEGSTKDLPEVTVQAQEACEKACVCTIQRGGGERMWKSHCRDHDTDPAEARVREQRREEKAEFPMLHKKEAKGSVTESGKGCPEEADGGSRVWLQLLGLLNSTRTTEIPALSCY